MIKFDNVSKYYKEKQIIFNQNFEIKNNEFFVLVGPSGSGKTTTLKMINKIIDVNEGYIYFNDKNINDYNLRELRLNIGYVLQQIALFPNLTVEENISLIPEMKKWDRKKIDEKIKNLLNLVGLDPIVYAKRLPKELSGGEQQRVGIVRSIIAEPEVLLMDEPFSALDPISREQLQDLIKKIHTELGITIIFVTHDIKEAMKLGDRICIMNQGKIIQIDTPENLKINSKNEFVREFLGLEKDNE